MYRKKQVLLIIESSRAYGRGLIQGVSRYVRKHEHWNIHFEEQGIMTSAPSWLENWNGDGIICRTGVSPLGMKLREFDCPLVELLGDGGHFISEVQSDAGAAGEIAAKHFIDNGLRNFAYYSYGKTWWCKTREKAFESALAKQGFSCDILSSQCDEKPTAFPVWESSYESSLLAWLEQLPKPIGIWTAADTVAQRVLAASQKLGFRVPDEVAILGIDNDTYLCNILTPTLSSIEPNSLKIGYHAAELLDQKMNNPESFRQNATKPIVPQMLAPLGVVTRQSTDIIAVDDPQMARIARFIRDNALHGIRVCDVAREFDLSQRTIERRYKKCFGKTIDSEISHIKIEHAKLLLRETLLPVATIGERVGFDANYFIKAFRREAGMPPRAFREKDMIGGQTLVSMSGQAMEE